MMRAKEEIEVILKKTHTKEEYQLFFDNLLRCTHNTPLTERKFIIYCLELAAKKLGNNIRPFLY